MEPPIVDTPKSGQPPYNGQTACPLPTTVCMLEPPKKGQHPNNGQNTRPQRVHCLEVPLYVLLYLVLGYTAILCIRSCVHLSLCVMSAMYTSDCSCVTII